MQSVQEIEQRVAQLHEQGGIVETHEIEREVRRYPAALMLLNSVSLRPYDRERRVWVLQWELSWMYSMRHRDAGQKLYKETLPTLQRIFDTDRTLSGMVSWSSLTDGGGVVEVPGSGVIVKPMILEARLVVDAVEAGAEPEEVS